MLASFQFPAFPRANATATTRPRISAVLCSASCSSPPTNKRFNFPLPTRRAALLLASSLTSSLLQFLPQCQFAKAVETDEPQEEDERVVRIFQVFLEGSNGRTFVREGRLVGFDPAYDLAVLKVDIERDKLRPALIGTSQDLRVGQNCFAIGNPYGYEHTLTTGVVSGLRREIPSPNGRAIRGAIQTDAAINAGIWAANTAGFEQDKGNSGGPLIDSYGHVIGVNTATFTRKGSGVSSGVNFAIPIDAVVRIIPSLIVNGTDIKDRF
ncbi:protease Do-like 5, chloroplastic isoform X4 [Dendrobium catenatum]|uniref:protease Do-like 5, chloroplastic isoform X4 n=1 Tax=Dendrobium catenatum TaxID=906689 RepID=UPI0009F3598C|nr:protease Do-like 5, chloroplastic isoform X4 [Dendrobium catenatum]